MYKLVHLCLAIISMNPILPVSALNIYEWTLDINTSSKHSSSTYGNNQYYNEDNDGFGFTYAYSEHIDTKVGYFKNSYNKPSFYAGFVFNQDYYLFNDMVFSPGIGVLFASGYENTPTENTGAVTPIIHPAISFGHRHLRSSIGYIPYGEHKVITFQTQIKF